MEYDELVKHLMSDLKTTPAAEVKPEEDQEENASVDEDAGNEVVKEPETGDEAGGSEVLEPASGAEGEDENRGEVGLAD